MAGIDFTGPADRGKKNLVKEVVTPHKLSLLMLIYDYSSMKTKSLQPVAQSSTDNPSVVFTQDEKRDFMVTLLKLLQSPDMELKDLLNMLRFVINPILFDHVTDTMKEFYTDGVKVIMDFFQSLMETLNLLDESNRLASTSVVGIFVRRMFLAYEKLTFSQVIHVYNRYRTYYDDAFGGSGIPGNVSMSLMSELSMSAGPLGLNLTKHEDVDGKGSTSDQVTGGFYSQKQAEFFISQQSFLLEHNENEALSPAMLQEKVQELLRINPDLAEAHFLSYMNSLRVHEYCTAVHNLYHYFDCRDTMADSQKSKDEDVSRRYAALNLAALHHRFGHKEESRAAIDEAIRMAQEANDHVCLQHALGWQFRLEPQGNSKTANLMDRSVAKTAELNLPYLTSLGVQAFAKHNALMKAQPASVFEFLLKSDILNCQHSHSAFMCVSYVQKAAMWQMYGKRESVCAMSQLALELDTSDCGVYHNGEATCIALCNLARQHADQGLYAAAFDIISSAKSRFPAGSQYATTWISTEQEIVFARAVHSGRWNVAEHAILNLKGVNKTEADIREAILLKEKGDLSAALQQCQKLLHSCKQNQEHTTPDYKCRVLLVLTEVYCCSANHTPAISHLLDCITVAKTHHLDYLAAVAGIYLAYVQFCMLLPHQASKILNDVLSTILTHADLYNQARALCLYAKCQVAVSKLESKADLSIALFSAANLMTSVIEKYKVLDDHMRVKDAIYYQARLYNELGCTSERNKCAYQFRQLDQQYPTLSSYVVNRI